MEKIAGMFIMGAFLGTSILFGLGAFFLNETGVIDVDWARPSDTNLYKVARQIVFDEYYTYAHMPRNPGEWTPIHHGYGSTSQTWLITCTNGHPLSQQYEIIGVVCNHENWCHRFRMRLSMRHPGGDDKELRQEFLALDPNDQSRWFEDPKNYTVDSFEVIEEWDFIERNRQRQNPKPKDLSKF